MGKSTTATSTPTAGMKRFRGKVAPVLVVLGTKAGSIVALGALLYVIVMFAGIRVIPLTLGFVKSGTGISESDPTLTVLAVFVAPGLFFVALITAAVIFGTRKLWQLRNKLVDAVSGWALGREAATVTPIAATAGAKTRPARSTKSA
jgi:hypothetical protein